jgi:F-type H+-transporting ATPase subunit c
MKKQIMFFAVLLASFVVANVVFAEGGESASVGSSLALGAAIIMAAACGMGTFSQSRAASAALEGIARNPQAADKVFTPLILSFALIESLVIFGFAIAYLLQDKIK